MSNVESPMSEVNSWILGLRLLTLDLGLWTLLITETAGVSPNSNAARVST